MYVCAYVSGVRVEGGARVCVWETHNAISKTADSKHVYY